MEPSLMYERIAGPATLLERWHVRGRRRPIGDEELRRDAMGLIESFDEVLALKMIELQIGVSEADEEDESREAEDTLDEDALGLSTILATLRRARMSLTGPGGDLFRRALKFRLPALAREYEEKLAQVLPVFDEFEKALILYGAGNERDAEIARSVVPHPDSVVPGPSTPIRW